MKRWAGFGDSLASGNFRSLDRKKFVEMGANHLTVLAPPWEMLS